MADFRKCFYALAVVALLACLTVPASAQAPLTCNTNASVPTIVRAEAYADLVGDLVLSCTGGVPTGAGLVVPSMNVTVFLSTNITSKLVGTTALGFNEALLIVDEPNSPANSNRAILNCGATGAPDNGAFLVPVFARSLQMAIRQTPTTVISELLHTVQATRTCSKAGRASRKIAVKPMRSTSSAYRWITRAQAPLAPSGSPMSRAGCGIH